jgi:hypothetical protein
MIFLLWDHQFTFAYIVPGFIRIDLHTVSVLHKVQMLPITLSRLPQLQLLRLLQLPLLCFFQTVLLPLGGVLLVSVAFPSYAPQPQSHVVNNFVPTALVVGPDSAALLIHTPSMMD